MTFGTPSMSTLERARVNRIYSTKTVLMALTMALFMLVMAMVITAGYVVSCDELHYETKRQLYGKTTLGKRKYPLTAFTELTKLSWTRSKTHLSLLNIKNMSITAFKFSDEDEFY